MWFLIICDEFWYDFWDFLRSLCDISDNTYTDKWVFFGVGFRVLLEVMTLRKTSLTILTHMGFGCVGVGVCVCVCLFVLSFWCTFSCASWLCAKRPLTLIRWFSIIIKLCHKLSTHFPTKKIFLQHSGLPPVVTFLSQLSKRHSVVADVNVAAIFTQHFVRNS